MATNQAIELKRVATVKVILENLAQGKKIGESCQIAGISPRTFRKWRKSGELDEYLGDMLQSIKVSGLSQIAEAWPGAVAQLCEDVQGTELSARDRDQRFRSLLQVIKTMYPDLSEPEPTGESAHDWLARQDKDRFAPLTAVQVNVAGDLVMEERGPKDFTPVQVNFPIAQQDANAAIEEEPQPEDKPTPHTTLSSEALERHYHAYRHSDDEDERDSSEIVFAGRKSV